MFMNRNALSMVAIAGLAGAVALAARTRTEEGTAQSGRGPAPADARSARDFRGPSPYEALHNQPPPKLIVDDPLPDLLDKGVVWIQYRTENVHILPIFGTGALDVSPRAGHLHVHVDDVPWWWADPSDTNTIDIAGMPPGEHKVRIDLVDPN